MKNKYIFNELTQKEFDFFYKEQNQYKIIPGLIGLLRQEIASNIANSGSYQYELAEEIIELATEQGMLKDRMYYYDCISFDENLERHLNQRY